jgi:hypothetical protein
MKEKNKHVKEPQGVGGWLLFFIITLVFVQPISYFFLILIYYDSLYIILYFILLSLSLFAGISLWNKYDDAVKIAKRYMIALIVFSIFDIMIVCGGLSSFDCGYYVGENLLSYFIYIIIWWPYLNISKRVKNTY